MSEKERISPRFNGERLKRINPVMERYAAEGKFAGMIVRLGMGEETVYQDKWGMMDREGERKMEFDTIFRIASMTKPLTCAALMTLYEEGHFQLNTPVSNFLPAFENVRVFGQETSAGIQLIDPERPVLFRHLFTHSAGLSYGWDKEDPVDRIYQKIRGESDKRDDDITLEDLTEMISRAPLAFQPGTRWRYSYSIDVLARIAEVISGKPFDEFLKERILDPLEMKDTDFYVPREKAHRLAALYGHPEGEKNLVLMEKPSESKCFTRPSLLSGGGGLFSTVEDYSRFLAMMSSSGRGRKNRILSPSTVDMFSRNFLSSSALPYGFAKGEDYYHMGYGYSLGTRVLMDPAASGQAGHAGEFGWDGAFNTYFWVDPVEGFYGIFMTQHFPNNYYPVAQTFKQLAYQSIE